MVGGSLPPCLQPSSPGGCKSAGAPPAPHDSLLAKAQVKPGESDEQGCNLGQALGSPDQALVGSGSGLGGPGQALEGAWVRP